MLDFDLFFRSLHFDAVVDDELRRMNSTVRKYMEAYAAGVNDYVRRSVLPLDFYMMGLSFEDWTVKDTLYLIKFQALLISMGWQFIPLRTSLMEKFGQELVDRILPITKEYSFLDPFATVQGNGKSLNPTEPMRSTQSTNRTKPKPGNATNSTASGSFKQRQSAQGSNAWVVHGNHTASGKPMVASDPHMAHIIPSAAYVMAMKFPDGTISIGASTAGILAYIIGRNEKMAWGITMTYAENIDLFSLKLNEQKTHYWYDGKWKPLEIEEVEIKVRGGEAVKYTRRKSHHGPIINATPGAFNFIG